MLLGVPPERWTITVRDARVLHIALYIRDVTGLATAADPELPLLDPPALPWPPWIRRPSTLGAAEPEPGASPLAAEQWDRWWRHLWRVGEVAMGDLRAPRFPAFADTPDLRALVRRHHDDALAWAEGSLDDPRRPADLTSPWLAINDLVKELEWDLRRPAGAFSLTVDALAVRGRRAWEVGPDRLVITRGLLADRENLLEWIRGRLRRLM